MRPFDQKVCERWGATARGLLEREASRGTSAGVPVSGSACRAETPDGGSEGRGARGTSLKRKIREVPAGNADSSRAWSCCWCGGSAPAREVAESFRPYLVNGWRNLYHRVVIRSAVLPELSFYQEATQLALEAERAFIRTVSDCVEVGVHPECIRNALDGVEGVSREGRRLFAAWVCNAMIMAGHPLAFIAARTR